MHDHWGKVFLHSVDEFWLYREQSFGHDINGPLLMYIPPPVAPSCGDPCVYKWSRLASSRS